MCFYFLLNTTRVTDIIDAAHGISIDVNPLRAKFFRGNKNMHLHFMSLLHIDMTQVLNIPPQVRPVPTYSTQSISLLLMAWLLSSPGHQQPMILTKLNRDNSVPAR